jgi:hypothetical protein
VRIRPAPHEPVGLELRDRLRHRLRLDPLGRREVADALRALAVEPPEHRAVGEGEGVLGAQAPHQPPEHHPQIGSDQPRIDLARHRGIQVTCIIECQ